MKKLLAILSALVLLLSLAACNATPNPASGDSASTLPTENSAVPGGMTESTGAAVTTGAETDPSAAETTGLTSQPEESRKTTGTSMTTSKAAGTSTTLSKPASTSKTTAKPTEPAFLYYDQSRVVKSKLTHPTVAKAVLKDARRVAGYQLLHDDLSSIQLTYDKAYAISCFPDLDVFGYGVTAHEMQDLKWGEVTFDALAPFGTDEKDIQINGQTDAMLYTAGFQLTLPFKTRDELLTAAKRDIDKYLNDLLEGGGGLIYVGTGPSFDSVDTDRIGVETLTEEDIKNAADGTGRTALMLSNSELFWTGDWDEYNMTIQISSKQENGVYYYLLRFCVRFHHK